MDYEKQIVRFMKRKGIAEKLGEGYQLTDLQRRRFCRLLDVYQTTKNMENMLGTVAIFIQYDLTNYLGRYNRLKGINGTSTYTQMLRYGRAWQNVYKSQNNKKTKAFTNRTQYWVDKGLSLDQAEQQVCRVQQERAIKSALKTKGTSCYTVRSTEFWINNGYSLEEAKDKVKDIQTTNGLEYYKKKYPDSYEKKFNERISKWKSSLGECDQELMNLKKSSSIKGCMARGMTHEEAVCSYQITKERLKSTRKLPSKISQKMCQMLDSQLKGTCYYDSKNYEKLISGYRVDFYHVESKTVIEFYGDFFHRNPKVYESTWQAHNVTSEQRWQYDAQREKTISNSVNVDKLIVIWESDFRKNPEQVIQNIIGEIK
jgi:very-short-patch-repair endonuclease